MADFNINLQHSLDPIPEEKQSMIDNAFEDTMNRSCIETHSLDPIQNRGPSFYSTYEDYSCKEMEILQTTKLGECHFEVPDETYFDNFDQLLIDDKKLEQEVRLGAGSVKHRKKDTPARPNDKSFSKPKAKYTSRVDVVNKGVLRMIKTFYQELLFEHFPEYKTKRLCRVNKHRLFDDVKSLLNLFPNKQETEEKIGECLFSALRPNDSHLVTKDIEFQKEVKCYFDCISKYSHKRLKDVFQTKFGKIIFGLVLNEDTLVQQLIDTNPAASKHKRAYLEAFERFKKGFGLTSETT